MPPGPILSQIPIMQPQSAMYKPPSQPGGIPQPLSHHLPPSQMMGGIPNQQQQGGYKLPPNLPSQQSSMNYIGGIPTQQSYSNYNPSMNGPPLSMEMPKPLHSTSVDSASGYFDDRDDKKKGAGGQRKKMDENAKKGDTKKKGKLELEGQQSGTPNFLNNFPPGSRPPQQGFPSSSSMDTQFIDELTEKPNLLVEGLHPVDRGVMSGSVLEGKLLSKEEAFSRQLMRGNLEYNNMDSSSEGKTVEYEPWMDRNVASKDVLDRACHSRPMEVSSDARRLLSNGIQNHLKTILETALEVSRKRLNRTALGSYHESLQHLLQNDGDVPEHLLNNVAVKWGPDVSAILREEETKMKQFYKDYCEIDEEKLKEKMKSYDEEKQKSLNKRKAGQMDNSSDPHWWDVDVSSSYSSFLYSF
jgi:hypothetical protein